MSKTKISGLLLFLVALVVATSIATDFLRHRRIPILPDTPRGLDIRGYHDLAEAQNGRLPAAAQRENVALQTYRVTSSAALDKRGVNPFSDAYFPKEKFDHVELRSSRIYGQYGHVFIALLGSGPIAFRSGSTDDLLQPGRDTAWACEINTLARDVDFASFVGRIDANALTFRDGRRTYHTDDPHLALNFSGDFRVNDLSQNTSYNRHESPSARSARQATTMTFDYDGKRLFLDFAYSIRREH